MKIKDRKGIENPVADHLSRMYFNEPPKLLINDSLRDDMLYKVTKTDPWYANIVNFMVACYMYHQEKIRRGSFMKVVSTYGIHPTSSGYAQMGCLEDVYQWRKACRSFKNAIHHHMEVIMGYSALIQKFGRVVFSGQPCMKTPKISSEDVGHVRGMEILILEMLCHSPIIFRELFDVWGIDCI